MCDYFDGIDADDWLIIGPLSEELTRERCEKEDLFREFDESDEYWDIITNNG